MSKDAPSALASMRVSAGMSSSFAGIFDRSTRILAQSLQAGVQQWVSQDSAE
jgi:hypothetical protein